MAMTKWPNIVPTFFQNPEKMTIFKEKVLKGTVANC